MLCPRACTVAGSAGFAALLALVAISCQRPPVGGEPEQPAEAPQGSGGRVLSGAAPAGSSCDGRDDCASDQVCVGGACRYRRTSAAGEILAMAAAAQAEAGDLPGATTTYDQAIEAFEQIHAPLPPEIACEAALAALRVADEAPSRETAAAHADRCFRNSLPGEPRRGAVERALARLRFDGLDLALFDRDEPAPRFFTKQQSRPTSDAIEIGIDIADRDAAGFEQLRDALRNERTHAVIVDCFAQDWELHHRRAADASLVLKFQTRMRDMGDYDSYTPEVQVVQTSLAQEGFEPCVASAITDVLAPGPRIGRPVSEWQEPFEISARLH